MTRVVRMALIFTAGCAAAPTPARMPAPSRPIDAEHIEVPRYRDLAPKDGILGGEIVFRVPGNPAQVSAMLLDFENDAANRAWRSSCRTLNREGDVHRCEAAFGDGILSVVRVLRYRVVPDGPSTRIEFRIENPFPGMTAFDGEYVVDPLPNGPTGCSVVRERLFIASGLVFRPVKREEIESGLKEDAVRIARWMDRRLQAADTAR